MCLKLKKSFLAVEYKIFKLFVNLIEKNDITYTVTILI